MAIKSVAIVTGASQGMGRATALRLARDCLAVVLVARNKDKLEAADGQVRWSRGDSFDGTAQGGAHEEEGFSDRVDWRDWEQNREILNRCGSRGASFRSQGR
jgi:NAD(P)-dependent dehydrogenase (short-subunit alcohol dehydrogenase family)